MGWHDKNSGGTTRPIGEKEPNDFGLHDMHGNVWEWCEDWHGEYFYSSAEASGPDPLCVGPGSGTRVIRGGGWSSGAGYHRSAYRDSYRPSGRVGSLGFRAAWSSP